MEAWNFLSAMGSSGAFRIRRAAVRVLPAGLVDAGSNAQQIFPWTITSCVYIWVALVAAGSSMFALARRWLDRRDAMFAAVLYAVNPYHLVIVYWRSAFAELLAASLVPLLLLFVLKAVDGERRIVIPLGLVLAGLGSRMLPRRS